MFATLIIIWNWFIIWGFFTILNKSGLYFGYGFNPNTLNVITICLSLLITFLATTKVGEIFFLKGITLRKPTSIEYNIIAKIINEITHLIYLKKIGNISYKIRIIDNPLPYITSIGKKTILLSSGLINNLNTNLIKVLASHELAHLFYKDKSRIMVIHATLSLSFIFSLMFEKALLKLKQISLSKPVLFLFGIIFTILFFLYNIVKNINDILLKNYFYWEECRADRFTVNLGFKDQLTNYLIDAQYLTNIDIISHYTNFKPPISLRLKNILISK